MAYDLYLEPDARGRLALPAGRGSVIDGFQKAVQSFVGVFLTELESSAAAPDEGNELLTELKFNNIRTEFQLQAQAAIACVKTVQQLSARHATPPPDTERIASASLERFTLGDGSAVLYIRLVNAAGDTRVTPVLVSEIATEE